MTGKIIFNVARAGLLFAAGTANAAVIQVSEGDFIAGSGLITFSEFGVGTINPIYAPVTYGGGVGSPTVTFDGFFAGQALSGAPGVDCPGASASACVAGSPSDPLALDAASPDTFITTDSANPTSPVLSGSPRFNGPIAVFFDVDVAGVGFDGGFFDAVGSTGITAFARDGALLGTVVNSITGIEFLGLVTENGRAAIAGVFLDMEGSEPAGFAIDNLRFGIASEVGVPIAPGPLPGDVLAATEAAKTMKPGLFQIFSDSGFADGVDGFDPAKETFVLVNGWNGIDT
ncbi:PEP-CTERM sorting domain-containing protein [Immundisolibacter sp.]|uniref:PEP-CTERM sorting domain-containing protein n=1 Tax=Immundisolibacter sp. TaxID=1934948 RepID=UPI003562222A